MSVSEIRRAKDELIKMSNDKKQREIYEMRAKILKDKVSALNKAREEGKEEGKIEEKYTIARQLLLAKVPVNIISESTGISVEEINMLKKLNLSKSFLNGSFLFFWKS